MTRLISIFSAILILACQPAPEKIIAEAIEAHGGQAYQSFQVEFDFRGKHFTLERNQGRFRYQRDFSDSTGSITDQLTNDGFRRYRDGAPADLSATDSARYANSVNSVAYFALLPYPLSDPAVRSKYLGEETVRGEPYQKIEVRFSEQGGGKDHDDVFVYWFHRQHHTLDYLAYLFHVNGGGVRFRETSRAREAAGIRFQDYNNFRGDITSNLADHARLFEEKKLERISEINLENLHSRSQ